MFNCCFTNEKYINSNGEINYKKYYKAVKNYIKYVLKQIKNKPKGSLKKGIPEITFNPNKICKCKCHYDNENLIH